MNKRHHHQCFHDPAEGGVAEQVNQWRRPDEDPQQLHQDDGTAEQIENLLEEDESVDVGPLGGSSMALALAQKLDKKEKTKVGQRCISKHCPFFSMPLNCFPVSLTSIQSYGI